MQSGFNLRKLQRFKRLINQGSNGPLRPVFKQWGVRYLAWTKRTFIEKSRGGGNWPPLKAATMARRRRGGASAAILRDTGTLFRALTPGNPGNLFEFIRGGVRGGVRVGFGGAARHPAGKATISDIARFHNSGEGRLPKRQIIYEPNKPLVLRMMNDLSRGIDRIGRST